MAPEERQAFLDGLHAEIGRLAARISVPADLLPQHGRSPQGTWISLAWRKGDDGNDPDGWYISLMRNEDEVDWELAEVLTEHSDYLLYVLFDEITAKLAKSAAASSIPGDRRPAWFAVQEELLGRLNNDWRARTAGRHAQMLKV
jgi:hypothetical protein